jgi:cytochrome d ubiquinol oxidase subunit II
VARDAYTAAALLWALVSIYALAGSVDFGATFWRMVFLWRGHAEAATVAEHYVSPLWEVTNVFLVLIAVVLFGFFPGATYALGTALLVPIALVLFLLALRGATLGYAYAGGEAARILPFVSGVTAILLPALLVLVLPASAGGFVSLRRPEVGVDLPALLAHAATYAYIAFGLAAALFISATFLADYARSSLREHAYRAYRQQALWAGPVMMAAGLVALFVLPVAPWLEVRLRAEWPWFLSSLLCFCAAMGVLAAQARPRWAVVVVGVQFLLADVGYGAAHASYLLYPDAPTLAAFSGAVMFRALLWVTLVGLALLVPAFVWLWRLFVTDPRYGRP